MNLLTICRSCSALSGVEEAIDETEATFVNDADGLGDADQVTIMKSLPLLLGATTASVQQVDGKLATKADEVPEVVRLTDIPKLTKEDLDSSLVPKDGGLLPLSFVPARHCTVVAEVQESTQASHSEKQATDAQSVSTAPRDPVIAAPPPLAVEEISDPTHPDYVPMALRHGPRERRHMEHLGLLPRGVAAVGGAAASSGGEALQQLRSVAAARRGRVEKAEDQEAAIACLQEFLTSHGFKEVNHRRRRGLFATTPLHEAVRRSDTTTVRRLLRARADASSVDSFRRTPLQLAQAKEFEGCCDRDVASILMKAERLAFNGSFHQLPAL